MGPLKSHLRDGGFFDLLDGNGLSARVTGEAGRIPPRTMGDGAALKGFLHPPLPPKILNAFGQAVATHSSLFLTRPDAAHATLPTA